MQWLPAAERNAMLDEMRDAGARWLRVDIQWSDVQPNATTYLWSPYDGLIDAARARGIKVLADITYTAPWALPAGTPGPITPERKDQWEKYAPANPEAYGWFAGQVAARYRGKVSHFEIWNEANIDDFFLPKPDAVKYVAMLRAAYTRIHAEQPSAAVVSSGLAPFGKIGEVKPGGLRINPITFLTQMYAAGAAGYFDALGWHPYNWSSGSPSQDVPWNTWRMMYATNPSARSLMTYFGDGHKKIWMTEWGYPSAGIAIANTTTQYAYLIEGYTLAKSYAWAGPLFWFSWDDGAAQIGTSLDSFGLFTTTGAAKPAYLAYRASALSEP